MAFASQHSAISCTIDLIVGGTRNWNKNELPRAIHQQSMQWNSNSEKIDKHSFEWSIDEVSFDHFLSAIQFICPFRIVSNGKKIIEFILQFNVEYKLPFLTTIYTWINQINIRNKQTEALHTLQKREIVERFFFRRRSICLRTLFFSSAFSTSSFFFCVHSFGFFCADLNP